MQQEVAATGREGSNRTHVVSTGRTADAVADSDRCVLLRTLSTFLNSTFLPVLLFAWRPPLPRGSSGYRHPETSTGLFFFLELRSHVVVGHLRSGATGGGTVPVLGRQIARRREIVRGGAHGDRRSAFVRSGAMAHEGSPGFQRPEDVKRNPSNCMLEFVQSACWKHGRTNLDGNGRALKDRFWLQDPASSTIFSVVPNLPPADSTQDAFGEAPTPLYPTTT